MKGSHKIIVETQRMKYEFTIRRNITVILGDSATGKTTLVELLNLYSRHGINSGVNVTSDVPCLVFNDISGLWQSMLQEIKSSIIFIDEGQSFIFTKEFAKVAQSSSNYYVLVTRRPLYNLPYSTKEIYGIRTTGRYHFPEKVYQEFYPIYSDETLFNHEEQKVLVLEDSNSGYEFFKQGFRHIDCTSAGGNSKVVSKITSINNNSNILVIADGAAFGAYIENLLTVKDIRHNVEIYLPESFEWMILKSGILNKNEISDILNHPEDYIDSSVYFTWERFFTDLLERETSNNDITRYSKSKINEYYISERNIRKILEIAPKEIKSFLES